MKKIDISFARDGISGLCKSPAIIKQEDNVGSPIAYLKKAKGATQEEFDAVADYLFPLSVKPIIRKKSK